MKALLPFAFLFATFGNLLHAQNETSYPQKGRIVTTDGNVIYFDAATRSGAQFRYYNYISAFQGVEDNKRIYTDIHVEHTIPAEDVATLDLRSGTKAWRGALRGASVGFPLNTFMIWYASASHGESGNTFVEDASMVVGATGLFAGIGALIGSGKKKYKTVYTNPKYGSAAPAWRLDLVTNSQQPGLTLRLSF